MVIVFDVNGTLLDTEALAPQLKAIFGTKYTVREWFHEVIEYAMALTLADDYREFGDVAMNVLQMAAEARAVRLRRDAVAALQKRLKHLSAFPDVKRSLARLHKGGFRLAALSNSGSGLLQEQFRHNGIAEYFDEIISVSAVRRYKPAREAYDTAAARMGVTAPEVLMVAAHPWDLIGAERAGCRTAFVARPGTSWFPDAHTPVHSVDDLSQLADRLLGDPASSRSALRWPIAGIGIAAAIGGLLLTNTDIISTLRRPGVPST